MALGDRWGATAGRYAETVIYRIFYALDRCGVGRLSLRDLKRWGGGVLPYPPIMHCTRFRLRLA